MKHASLIYLALLLLAGGLYFVVPPAAGFVLLITFVGGFVHAAFSSTGEGQRL